MSSEKRNEDENQKSSNEGVFEGGDENCQRDEEELPQDLNAGPGQHTSQSDGHYVVRIRVQQIPELQIEYGQPVVLQIPITVAAIGLSLLLFGVLPQVPLLSAIVIGIAREAQKLGSRVPPDSEILGSGKVRTERTMKKMVSGVLGCNKKRRELWAWRYRIDPQHASLVCSSTATFCP